jgi:IS5 family transposase
VQGRCDDQRELLDAESVAGHLLKSESVFAFLAAHRSELFPAEMFADLFPSRRGRPSVPAEVMASVITLQALHGLSDNGRWRIAQRVAPDRIISTVDPEARRARKTVHRRQDGFKAHVAVEPDTGIITDCALTKAGGAGTHDAAVGSQLLAGETAPVTVLADSAYGSGEFRAHLKRSHHHDRVKPAPLRAAVPGGLTLDDFTVDHRGRLATCPAGVARTISARGNAVFGAACRHCALRAQCTTSATGRSLKIGPDDALERKARQQARKVRWLNEYRQHRPMVERTIAWLTRGNRKVRYPGVARNDHWLHHRAAALNLSRLITLVPAH